MPATTAIYEPLAQDDLACCGVDVSPTTGWLCVRHEICALGQCVPVTGDWVSVRHDALWCERNLSWQHASTVIAVYFAKVRDE